MTPCIYTSYGAARQLWIKVDAFGEKLRGSFAGDI
jgi:hypothetical protein